MAAQFQLVSVARTVNVPISPEPDAGTGSWPPLPQPRKREFAWRFMSTNHRTLATSAHTFANVKSCLATIHTLQDGLPLAVGETLRNQHGHWVWRVRVNDDVLATAARSYSSNVRAQLACNIFLQLIAETVPPTPVHVIYQ